MALIRISEERKKFLSEQAKAMHEETVIDQVTGLERRKFGGVQPRSGRPRKPRPTEVMAEMASTEGAAYFQRLDDIAKNHPSANTSISAIREILEVVDKERKIADEQEQKLERLQRDDLILLALDLIKKTGIIPGGTTIDGEFEEIEDGGYTELSP